MPTGNLDLSALALRLANRTSGRTEANVQSDLHAFLLAAPLELDEADLNPILEQQVGGGRRIDVEAGFCVFEVKRDLRKGHVRQEAITQLAGYVASRTEDMQQRYVGVLTDGAPAFESYREKYENVRMRREDGILEVALHTRGGPLEFNGYVHEALVHAFRDVGDDRDNHVVILTGAGNEAVDRGSAAAPKGFELGVSYGLCPAVCAGLRPAKPYR